MRAMVLLTVAMTIVAPAAGARADTAPTAAAPADHPVGPEDLLEISVFEIPELNRTVRVSERGTISLPLLGEMEVRGLTTMELEGRLRQELSRKYVKDPQISVFVREYGSKKVSVIGAVGKPGVYEMLGPRTLLQVLSQAGGLTEDAGAEMYVIRGGGDHGSAGGSGSAGGGGNGAHGGGRGDGNGARIAIPVEDLMASRNPDLNVPIQPGDVVSVPIDRQVYVYVDGAVKTPGRIEQLASRPITLLQAIAKAGGTTDRANLKGVQILRQNGKEEQTVLEVSLKRIRQGKEPDPPLKDGDIVVVPETFF